jgi:hypothetical protein
LERGIRGNYIPRDGGESDLERGIRGRRYLGLGLILMNSIGYNLVIDIS